MRLFPIALFCVAVPFAFSACQEQEIDTQRQDAPSSLARVLGPALTDECPAGGVELEYGIDTNQDGTLDDLEGNGSYSICHGEAGQDGKPCISMPNDDGSDDAMPALDVVPDKSSEGPGERISREELLSLVAQKLSEQEYRIVYLKYWEELPMREIGQLTGLSESRVCKIHSRLIGRLRERFRVDQPL